MDTLFVSLGLSQIQKVWLFQTNHLGIFTHFFFVAYQGFKFLGYIKDIIK